MSKTKRPELIEPSDLAIIVKDVGGISAAAVLADVNRSTMSNYVRGRTRIPKRALDELMSWWKLDDDSKQK